MGPVTYAKIEIKIEDNSWRNGIFKNSVNNVHILDAPEEDLRQYLKFLWNKGLSDKGKGNIRKNLSQEKSAVYASIENCFKRKYTNWMQVK